MIKGVKSEIGRELTSAELIGRERTIFVLKSANTPYVTMWLATVDSESAVFFAADIGMTAVLKRRDDGTLCDGIGNQIHVYEFLPAGGIEAQ